MARRSAACLQVTTWDGMGGTGITSISGRDSSGSNREAILQHYMTCKSYRSLIFEHESVPIELYTFHFAILKYL